MKKLIAKIGDIIKNREQAILCTVVGTKGSTPLKSGSRMIVWENGEIYGTVGGGAFEKSVIERSDEIIRTQESKMFEHHLTKDHDMCCGGSVSVYMEPISIPYQLIIFGAGHVSKALVDLSVHLDFEVKVIDDRKDIFRGWDKSKAELINGDPGKIISKLTWDDRTYGVIVTYSHPLDREILARTIQLDTGYLGMIGSKRKVAITRKLFLEESIASEQELDRVDMPIGLDIKAHTPHEIAVSIFAGLIRARNTKIPNEKAGFSIEELQGKECFEKIDKTILKEIAKLS